jgi:hypothetical protein
MSDAQLSVVSDQFFLTVGGALDYRCSNTNSGLYGDRSKVLLDVFRSTYTIYVWAK